MEAIRPEFVPDPSLSREEMEALQRDIAGVATFEDDFEFDIDAVRVSSPTPTNAGGEQTRIGEAGRGDAGGRTDVDGGPAEPVVAGVDQAFVDDRAVSGIVVVRGDELVERVHAITPLSIPYIPGFLSFREGGSILAAFEALSVEPDLALFDGSGRIHFRQAGLATHMGVVLDLPSVGVAKRLLCGTPRRPVDALSEGERVPIEGDERVEGAVGEVIGYAVQTRQFSSSRRINPVYVSPGHRVAAETAAALTLSTTGDYKLPEPTRLADRYVGEIRDDLNG